MENNKCQQGETNWFAYHRFSAIDNRFNQIGSEIVLW